MAVFGGGGEGGEPDDRCKSDGDRDAEFQPPLPAVAGRGAVSKDIKERVQNPAEIRKSEESDLRDGFDRLFLLHRQFHLQP